MTAYLTTAEVGQMLKVSAKTVTKLPIPYSRLRSSAQGQRRYDPKDVYAFMEDQRQCQSTSAKARRITTSNSNSTVSGFDEALMLFPGGKRKRLNGKSGPKSRSSKASHTARA